MDDYVVAGRPPCRRCGVGKRLPANSYCAACRETLLAEQSARAQGDHAAMMQYSDPTRTSPEPVPAPGKPSGACPRCGRGVWLDLSDDIWACQTCNFRPGESGVRPLPADYYPAEPSPAPPSVQPWICGVCGPVAMWTRDDGSQQCSLCGAVRA
jgi:ribosomal protein L37AE/L43A